MTDESFTTGKCAECGGVLSLEVGITNYGPEGGSKLYCTPCAPNRGKGYTLADIERMKAESRSAWEKTISDREIRMMDQLGADVYFHVLDHAQDHTEGTK